GRAPGVWAAGGRDPRFAERQAGVEALRRVLRERAAVERESACHRCAKHVLLHRVPRRNSDPGSQLWRVLEAIQPADGEDVDIALAGIVAADLAEALPFRAHGDVLREVVARAQAEGEVRVVVALRGAAAREGRRGLGDIR